MDEILQQIFDFAKQAHGDQQRKFAPEPYIAHPLRVMNTCEKYTTDITVLAAALLHDVLEDTAVDKEQINDFLLQLWNEEKARRTIQMVEELTDIYTKDQYPKWNRRKRKMKEAERLGKVSAGAQTIKYADIIDNSLTIVDVETDFAKKYLYECKALLKEMKKGDPKLYIKAIETVNDCIKKLK